MEQVTNKSLPGLTVKKDEKYENHYLRGRLDIWDIIEILDVLQNSPLLEGNFGGRSRVNAIRKSPDEF